MSFSGIRAVLFDLDGTLVDSVPDLATAVDAMLAELDREPAGEARVRQWVGNGAQRLVKRALTGAMDTEPAPDVFEQAFPRFLDHYARHLTDRSQLYGGAREALAALRGEGLALGLVTNKPERYIAPLLGALGIAQDFAVVVGGDTLAQKKPHPAPLLHAARQLGAAPAATAMVGDSRNDVLAARGANMRVICVPYGYNHGEDIQRAEPDALVEDLRDIMGLLKSNA
jgi:phosphoglycolate phosphatase